MTSETVAGGPVTLKLDLVSYILVLNLISRLFLRGSSVCLSGMYPEFPSPLPCYDYFYIKKRFFSLFSWCFRMKKCFIEKFPGRSKETRISRTAKSSLSQHMHSALVLSYCTNKGCFIYIFVPKQNLRFLQALGS